jgi:hypothetical protein
MIPRIIFRHSHYYDQIYRDLSRTKDYPKEKEIVNYIYKIQKIWKSISKKIIKELEKVTKLEFKDDKIICYVVGKAIPFSDPLTLPIFKNDYEYFIDNLIHELIHILFTQEGNLSKAKNSWKYIFNKYKSENFNTKLHIPVHAVHYHIYLRFFGEERLNKDIKLISFLDDYRRSWNIVNKEGYGKILEEFVKRISD